MISEGLNVGLGDKPINFLDEEEFMVLYYYDILHLNTFIRLTITKGMGSMSLRGRRVIKNFKSNYRIGVFLINQADISGIYNYYLLNSQLEKGNKDAAIIVAQSLC